MNNNAKIDAIRGLVMQRLVWTDVNGILQWWWVKCGLFQKLSTTNNGDDNVDINELAHTHTHKHVD